YTIFDQDQAHARPSHCKHIRERRSTSEPDLEASDRRKSLIGFLKARRGDTALHVSNREDRHRPGPTYQLARQRDGVIPAGLAVRASSGKRRAVVEHKPNAFI